MKNFKEKNGELFNNAYSYLLQASCTTEEELQGSIKKGYEEELQGRIEKGHPIVIKTDNHKEFYEANKNAINTLVSDVNCGDYYFLQETYTELARDMWLSATTSEDPVETIAHYTVDFVLNAVIKIIKKDVVNQKRLSAFLAARERNSSTKK